MALRFSATHITNPEEGSDPEYRDTHPEESSSEDEDEDLTWDDWVSDSLSKHPCKSLFENKTFDTVQEALAFDENTHGFSLKAITARLSKTGITLAQGGTANFARTPELDPYKRIRLINWIRKEV